MIKAENEVVEKTSPDLVDEQTEQLKHIFPQVFSEGKIDFDKLRTVLGDIVDDQPEKYSFTWAGKRNATQLLQTPSHATLVPAENESINFDTTQNLFLEGDNLEILKLLYKSYSGQIKMIYIDPPYNTGNDFVYPDNFVDPLENYLEITGQKDANGNLLTSNPETSGRYHSTWLSMMYPRLFLARQLLQDDGAIFISIDDHEINSLRMLMNEVFGEENFIAQITVQSNPRGRQAERFVATVHEYILIYARDAGKCRLFGASLTEEQLKEFKYQDESGHKYRLLGLRQRGSASRRQDRPNMFYPIYVDPHNGNISTEPSQQFTVEVLPKKSNGEDGRWMWSKKKVQDNIGQVEARLISTRNEWDVFVRDPLELEEGEERTRKIKTIWNDKGLNYQHGTQELKELFGRSVYDYPKPTSLLLQVIMMAGDPDGLYLDFFAGSCTTAQAILELNHRDDGNRRFIMVQLPERTNIPDYPTIAEIGKERIRRVIAKVKKEDEGTLGLNDREGQEDLGFRVFKLALSNYKQWNNAVSTDIEAYTKQLAVFTDPLIEGWSPERVIWEVAIKEGFGLNASVKPLKEIPENTVWLVADPDKEQSFLICLDNLLLPSTLSALPLTKDHIFVCLNKALDDTVAANLALQCRLKKI